MSRFVALVFVAGVWGVFAPGPAQAQSSIPREETWVTNGAVYAIAPTSDTVYIGGSFTHVGPLTGCGTPLDVSTGQVQTPFPKVNGTVWACASDGLGGWFIGGWFTRVGNLERNGVAHILSDGSVDPAWNPNADSWVGVIVVSGSTVYAGGTFTSIGGQSRNHIAALDAATGNATPWNPSVVGGSYPFVSAIADSGSAVYVGGDFTSIGGQPRNNIAALDAATGSATAWNPNAAGGDVRALAVSGSTVYVGGYFTSIGGQSRSSIAALDAATGNATPWNPNANGGGSSPYVSALVVSGSTVYAGGGFGSIGGQSRHCIAALDATTGNATAWKPHADSDVYALAVSGSTVYVGGAFMSIGGQPRNRIAALDTTTGNATTWNPNAWGDVIYPWTTPYVSALVVSGPTVYAGGWFTSIGGQSRNYIAALDAVTGNATAWNPNASNISSLINVRALAVSGSTVYAGGEFTTIGGEPRPYFAQFDTPPAAAARMWPLY